VPILSRKPPHDVNRDIQHPQHLSAENTLPFHHRRHAADELANPAHGEVHIVVKNLTMAYGDYVVMRDLNFAINRGEIFVIMGPSGCGKSTLLRHLIGLNEPAKGEVWYGDFNFTRADPLARRRMVRHFGVLYQGGALWSSMTLAENIALPLEEFTDLDRDQIEEMASLKLSLVGLKGFENYYPSQISGGMQKRAGLARAIALNPEVLFLDEPSAGLDPISSRLLDDLILELRNSLGATLVVVSHELASIFAIGNNSIFLDPESRTITAQGNPKDLLEHSGNPIVHRFLSRGESQSSDAVAAGKGNQDATEKATSSSVRSNG
jgi:phospholipid/cholesterol/gamma-HCH transport system ATP-binding protein